MSSKILLVEPQKSKKYHTSYPPLGLLKLASYHKQKGDKVRFVQGFSEDGFEPNAIYITSLFTYAYEPVHDVISYYSQRYKKARIIVGGIYATLCPDHLKDTFGNRIEIHQGLLSDAENILPDYSLVPEWNASILFSSRGCIRKCHFCSVPILEPTFKAKKSIRHLIYYGHKKIIFWDNNILASPYWRDIFDEIGEMNLEVDFNQGLDARLITEEVASRLKRLKLPLLRLAYDSNQIRTSLNEAINLLKSVGFKGRRILVYCLHNTRYDTPEDFHNRIKDILNWGVVAYPMRYEPLEPRPKNTYVSPNWTAKQLEMIAKARRVIGYGGAFPPYDGLKKKFLSATNFEKAFELRPYSRM
ncbi:MAG: hypothetical protein AB1480_14480 [Nitrospirota bacterium]